MVVIYRRCLISSATRGRLLMPSSITSEVTERYGTCACSSVPALLVDHVCITVDSIHSSVAALRLSQYWILPLVMTAQDHHTTSL